MKMNEENKLIQLVEDGIGVLSSYFEVCPEELTTFERPSIWTISDYGELIGAGASNSNKQPSYNPETNTISFPLDLTVSMVGHEISHWFHNQINPELFTYKKELAEPVIECVGVWGELIYTRNNLLLSRIFLNSVVTLSEFSRMTLNQTYDRFPNIKSECEKMFYLVRES